jgi:aminoglycoside phosphotransferase (APT) family kinase protein
VRTWDITGGMSSAMTVIEAERPDGTTHRLVVRRARERPDGTPARMMSIRDEHDLLVHLSALGLPVPTPRLLDDSRALLPDPFAVYDFVDGAIVASTPDPVGVARTLAHHLVAIHDVDGSADAFRSLPDRADRVAERLARPPDPDQPEAEAVRQVLRDAWPPLAPATPSLLHGDFWPGNLLWRDGELVAVIDWENACVGDPLGDVSITRLDLLWAYGPEATTAFTEAYGALRTIDHARLALWDLVAAVRPTGVLSAWAVDWQALGHPDLTTESMQTDLQWFTDQALAVWRTR